MSKKFKKMLKALEDIKAGKVEVKKAPKKAKKVEKKVEEKKDDEVKKKIKKKQD